MGYLEGLRVVDASRLLPGGYASMLLADMGAEVIKVEQPGIGDYMRATPPTINGESPVHSMVNRGKLSVGIDLKQPEGKKALRRLLAKSDVFVEAFRPGVMTRLGFSFTKARLISPRVVYCSISAFGQESSLSSRPAHDINFQALAGTLDYPRRAEVPLLQLGDMVSGTFAALAILGAVAGGKRPAYIDVPIVPSLTSWMVVPIAAYLASGTSPREGHSLMFGSTPYYNLFRTSDGRYMAVAAIEEGFWRRLVHELGVPHLEHKRFGSIPERKEVTSTLKRVFASKSRAEWTRLLSGKDTCATPVLSVAEALRSEWARSVTDIASDGTGTAMPANPLRGVPDVGPRHPTVAPSLGKDTDSVLGRIGYSGNEIAKLRSKGAVQ